MIARAITMVSGIGLIKCGSVVIPFDNQISKDTDCTTPIFMKR